MAPRCALFVALTMAVLICGCGDTSKNVPVKGKVTLKGGDSIAKGTITFHPDATKGNKSPNPAVGNIENGQYSASAGKMEGAPVGWYKVTINASVPSNPKDEYSVPKSLINEKYNDVARTDLAVEVKEGTPSYDFQVTK